MAPVHQLTVEEYIAATSENGAQGTQVIDDEDVAAERELQQPVSAAEPEHEAATSFESKRVQLRSNRYLPGVPLSSKSAEEKLPPPRTEGRRGQENYFQQNIRRIVAGSSDLRL